MKPASVDTVFVVGAGFSLHAGLPLTNGVTAAMLEARAKKGGPSKMIVDYLSKFIRQTFNQSTHAKAELWPNLEDIFTSVDLSANSGHHLGGDFAPADLRTVRRAMLARIVRMLHQKYQAGLRGKPSQDWIALDHFFASLDLQRAGFISMNWDTVIERKIGSMHNAPPIDYRCDASEASIPDLPNKEDYSITRSPGAQLRKPIIVETAGAQETAEKPRIPIIKIHGSINWLYCDNCRRVFWFNPRQELRVADQLLTKHDLERINTVLGSRTAITQLAHKPKVHCLCSGQVPLGTRIATFSYRKALEFPMFQKSWFAAETLLGNAARWVFIGYSLPAADFEFKYLLKRTQLSRVKQPEIIVVSGGDEGSLKQAKENYSKFFGSSIPAGNFYSDGLRKFSR